MILPISSRARQCDETHCDEHILCPDCGAHLPHCLDVVVQCPECNTSWVLEGVQ